VWTWEPQVAFADPGRASATPTASASSAGQEEEQEAEIDPFTPPDRKEGQ
jgi:hypothetical protein